MAGSIITVANPSEERFGPKSLMFGRPLDGGDAVTEMGQHGLGLKDALAILCRLGCKVFLQSHGLQVDFKETGLGGLLPDRERAIECDGEPFTDAGMLCYRTKTSSNGSPDRFWKFTINTASVSAVSQLNANDAVLTVRRHFMLPDASELIYDGEDVAVYKPNVVVAAGKTRTPKRFGLEPAVPDTAGGVYIGGRFVVVQPGVSTYFGYHVKAQTKAMKRNINRDQQLTSALDSKTSPIRDILVKTWKAPDAWEKLKAHLPDKPTRELAWLRQHVPELDPHFQARKSAAKRLPGQSQSATRTGAAATSSPPRPTPNAPFAPPASAISNWFDQQGCLARHLDKARVTTLRKLNKIAEETFPDDYVQLVPYGSTIYEVTHSWPRLSPACARVGWSPQRMPAMFECC